MARRQRVISCPAEALAHLRGGDTLARAGGDPWCLVLADAEVCEDAVAMLLIARFVLRKAYGRLVPLGDGLPGFGVQLSQSWGWRAEISRPAAR